MHEDKNDFGDIKPKTIGKLLDEKVCIEGMFTIVLRCIEESGNSRYKNNKNNKNNKNIKEEPAALPSEDDNDDGIDPMEAMRIWNERQKK